MNRDRVGPAARTVLRASWLILPVVVGGLGHVAVLKTDFLGGLAVPIDRDACWRGRPVFGANKTWRGMAVMATSTALASGLQAAFARHNRRIRDLPSARVNAWLAGALCGLAYCLAELPNSFVKRRLGIAPGARASGARGLQYVVDQADSVAGCLVPLRLLYRPDAGELLAAFALGLTVHIGIDQLMFAIRVKSRAG